MAARKKLTAEEIARMSSTELTAASRASRERRGVTDEELRAWREKQDLIEAVYTVETALRAAVPPGTPPVIVLHALLLHAGEVAEVAGLRDMLPVLEALREASTSPKELAALLDRKGTMGGVARATVGWKHGAGPDRQRKNLMRRLVKEFAPVPIDAADLSEILESVIPKLNLLGHGKEGYERSIMRECSRIRESRTEPRPIDYVRAVLRGWGATAAQAKDWTKGMA